MAVEKVTVQVGSETLTFETGRIAKQAQGAVLVTAGETMVLSAVCVASDMRPGQDFFPLTVDYREKSSAAGRIPGNYFRREARPSEREVLMCRLTDRPLRPLFPKGFMNETQVFGTVFSADNINDPGVMSINGASAALHLSPCPFAGPIGAVRVGMIDGELIVNPQMPQMDESDLDLIMAGTADAIMMVEGAAFEIDEDTMVAALEFGHGHIKNICAAIEELHSRAGKEKMSFEAPTLDEQVLADVEQLAVAGFPKVLEQIEKFARADTLRALKNDVRAQLAERYGEERYAEVAGDVSEAFGKVTKKLMRKLVTDTRKRLDGRDLDTVRPISIELGLLPRAHGSALFTRGETQTIVTTTLGTSRDEQRTEELTGSEFRRFILHYNFPPWSVGEVKRVMGPGRREIGHGKLAERALESVLPFFESDEEDGPAKADFPYTIRILSDVTESNGSSSMATVCGGTLSLMDAGVPIHAPVAGIAMGLIKEGDDYAVLSDILGDEDHLGDMDFKICGTREGITAFQMDIKLTGLANEVMKEALYQARAGRLHILDEMEKAIAEPRAEYSPYAPKITSIKVMPDQIREIIGPGGKVIRDIQAQSGAQITVDDDGTVTIAAVDAESASIAVELIRGITAMPEVGEVYHGTVTRIMNFGAFVAIMGGKEGLVHISELAPGRVDQVTDVVNTGDDIDVKLMEIDSQGRINLSKVQADLALGRVTQDDIDAGRANGGGGGGGRPGGGGGGGRGREGGGRREGGGFRGGPRSRR